VDDTDHLWIGSWAKITILDLNTDQVLLERKLALPGRVDGIVWTPEACFFLQNGLRFDSLNYSLYRWLTPVP
jgi:hypothetical protein